MLVTEYFLESRYDHGDDKELQNGPEIKIDIWDNSVWSPKGFRMFPEMFGYENTLFGPKGKAHKVFGKCKRNFYGVQGEGNMP